MKIRNLLVFFCFIVMVIPAFAQEGDARDAYNAHKNYYNSGKDIQNKLINPLVSETPMVTATGESFSAQLQCSSDNIILEVEMVLSSNGEGQVKVSQAPSGSGSLSHYYTSPNISGVCTNGFMSCTSGTTNNCRFYEWEVTDRKIGVRQLAADKITGECYCTNKACNRNIGEAEFPSLAGSAAAAVMHNGQQLNLFSSSSLKTSYSGQDTGNCQVGKYGDGDTPNPGSYYKKGELPNASGYIADQSVDPNSWYSQMDRLQDFEYETGKTIGRYTTTACYESNQIQFFACPTGTTAVETPEGTICRRVIWQGESAPRANEGARCVGWDNDRVICLKWEFPVTTKSIDTNGDDYSENGFTFSKSHYVEFYLASRSGADRHWMAKVTVNDNTILDIPSHTDDSTYGAPAGTIFTTSPADHTKGDKTITIHMDAYEGGKSGSISIGARLYEVLTPDSDKIAKIINVNGCSPNSACKLVKETVCVPDKSECFDTVANGLKQSASKKLCYQEITATNTYIVCSDGQTMTATDSSLKEHVIGSGWFNISREYSCETGNSQGGISDLMKNTFDSLGSMGYTESTGTMYYKDMLTGEIHSTSGFYRPTGCIAPTCTVYRHKDIAKVLPTGASDNVTTTVEQNTQNQLPTYIRMCENINNAWTCPYDNETETEWAGGCRCDLTEMGVEAGMATAVMTVIEQAVKSKMCLKRSGQ